MPMSPYIKRLREAIGSEVIQIPSVSVLPFDDAGRVLLVFQRDVDSWSTLGGSIELDETPEEAATREALEEAGVTVRLDGIITVLGGPQYRTRYPNGDEVAYVNTIYRGTVIDGIPRPDGDEVTDVRWISRDGITGLPLTVVARGLFAFLGWL